MPPKIWMHLWKSTQTNHHCLHSEWSFFLCVRFYHHIFISNPLVVTSKAKTATHNVEEYAIQRIEIGRNFSLIKEENATSSIGRNDAGCTCAK